MDSTNDARAGEQAEEEGTTGRPSRRALLGAGAAGLGVAAAAAMPALPAMAASSPGSVTPESAGAALGLPPSAVPVALPATYMGAVAFPEVGVLDSLSLATRAFNAGGVYRLSGSGFLNLVLPLQAGDELVRVDVYFKRQTSGSATAALDSAQVDTGVNAFITLISTGSGTGIVSGGYQPGSPRVVAPGEQIYLETQSAIDGNCVLLGAIFQYRPARPQLNLLAAPVRVYDTRPGNLPNTGPKTPLVGGTPRTNIAANNNGSGVASGSRAILANVTVVNTVGSGFLLLYKNGISVPLASTINWFGTGQVLANGTTVALDSQARFSAFVGSGAQTDFFVDVLGYYV